MLTDHTVVSVKRLSATRWSAHHSAVKPVKETFVAAIEALHDPHDNLDTRGIAQDLLPAVCDFCCTCTSGVMYLRKLFLQSSTCRLRA